MSATSLSEFSPGASHNLHCFVVIQLSKKLTRWQFVTRWHFSLAEELLTICVRKCKKVQANFKMSATKNVSVRDFTRHSHGTQHIRLNCNATQVSPINLAIFWRSSYFVQRPESDLEEEAIICPQPIWGFRKVSLCRFWAVWVFAPACISMCHIRDGASETVLT